ncbi:hypothetical protein DFP96_10239 [Listeria rocourtiae]|uniref:Uncharacterized protein n=1 Tax=Listeria rocourtiae TaxID=647910 RepID=A0A4R6ZPT2_9LIST|nr:hypothetical protein DFP96_10239 [Listeria rocourtiae]
MIDAKIKTINTKENNDDMLYPVVSSAKTITSAAIPIPLKNAFHKWLTLFYSISLSFIADIQGECLIIWKKTKKDDIHALLATLKVKIITNCWFAGQAHENNHDNTAYKWNKAQQNQPTTFVRVMQATNH